MGIFRGSKGEIREVDPDDVTTQILDRTDTNIETGDVPTVVLEPLTGTPRPDPVDDPNTVLIRPKRAETDVETDADEMNNPVVGWVVVIKGPGQGRAVKLGYGQNSIGRGRTERVSLDFGSNSDSQISRSKHAIITYDPKSKKYYVQTGAGDSVNLTYIGDTPVLVPTEITGGEHIVMGDTTLRFVAFCGEEFDWQLDN